MYRTFNCGIGMVLIVPAAAAAAALQLLRQAGEGAQLIGEVQRGDGGVIIRA
jgi:phosphoribosylformylglycinamidine cyclo-ligase